MRCRWKCSVPKPFFPSFPAGISGPLCRSAASGYSVRARALLAPPPFLTARTPSRLVLDLLFVAIPSAGDSAARVWCGPRSRGPSGRGGIAWFPPRLPRGRGRRLGIGAVRPLNGLGEALGGRLTDLGPGPRVFPPKFPLSEVGTERNGRPRPHPLPVLCPFPAGEAPCFLYWGDELIWLVRLQWGRFKSAFATFALPRLPTAPGKAR